MSSNRSLAATAAAALACGLISVLGGNTANAQAADTLTVPPVVTSHSRALPSYLHDVSKVDPTITDANVITEHYAVTAPDGVKLDTWIVRPDLPGKRPLVLQFTPYYGGGTPQTPVLSLFDTTFQELLHRGYAIGISSMRGTGNSGGCFTIGSKAESKDDSAVIEFLARRSWSNGNVGLMGVSYPGTAPQDAWVEAPPHLKTIVPVEGITDLYKYNFVNGVPVRDTEGFPAYYWVITGLGPAGLNEGVQAADPVSMPGAMTGEVCQERIPITEEAANALVDGDKDAYWQERDFLRELKASPDKKRASVLYVQGFADWNVKTYNTEGWLPAVQATGVPFKALMGQWVHEYPTREDWLDYVTAWFDQFLWERNTGILDAPKVQLQDDSGAWRNESQWPPPVTSLTVHPDEDGSLGTTKGAGFASYDDLAGAPVQAVPVPGDRVQFTSAPLSRDLHLSGMPRFEGTVTASGDTASLMLSLGDQAPDGTITWTNWACQSLNHAANLEHGKESVAGLPQKVGVNFASQEDVIQAGHRIVLVAAGNLLSPSFNMRPVTTGSTMSIDLASASLILPQDTSLRLESAKPDAQSNVRLQRMRVSQSADGTVLVTASVVNTGAVGARGFSVALRDGTRQVGSSGPFALAAGAARRVSWSLNQHRLGAGPHLLTALADAADALDESFENDNTKRATVWGNDIANGSFESGEWGWPASWRTSGWVKYSTTGARASAGTDAVGLIAQPDWAATISTDRFAVAGGLRLRVGAAASGGPAELQMTWYDAAGRRIGRDTLSVVRRDVGAWANLTAVAVPPARAAFARLAIVAPAPARIARTTWVDDVWVTRQLG